MHIFVADEHPPTGFANACPRALQIPRCEASATERMGRKKGDAVKTHANGCCSTLPPKPDLSRSTDESRRHHFGSQRCF